MAYRAQQLLEHSLLGELRAVVARALSGLDMFAEGGGAGGGGGRAAVAGRGGAEPHQAHPGETSSRSPTPGPAPPQGPGCKPFGGVPLLPPPHTLVAYWPTVLLTCLAAVV